MSTVGYATLPVIPSLQGMERHVQRQLGGLTGISQQIGSDSGQGFMSRFASNTVSGLNQVGDRIVSTLGTAFRAAGAAGAVTLGATLWGGLQRVLDTEDARKMFGQLGLGVSETDALMGDLRDTFETGPFAYPDVYDISSQLMASGVGMESLVGVTEAVGNMAAFAGEDLSRVGEVTSVIGANGRVMASELNRLAQMGIPIRQILAEGLGLSGDELMTMVSNGELTSDMFFDLIGNAEQFEDAMDEFASTTRGAWKNMRSAIAGVGEALLSPWFGEDGTMVNFLQTVNDFIFDRLQPTMAEWGQWLHDVGVPALRSLGETFQDRVLPALEGAWEWFERNRGTIADIARAVGPAVVIIGGLATAVNLVTRALRLLGISTPVGILIALASAITYAWQNSETFRNVVTGTWETIRSVVGPIIDWFGERISWVAGLFSGDGEGGAIRAWWEEHVRPVMESLMELFSAVGDRISEVTAWWMEQLSALWDEIGEPVMTVMSAAWEQLKDTVQFVWDVIRTVIETTLGVIGGIIDTITAVIRGDWEGAHEALLGIGETVWDGIRNIVSYAIDFVRNTISRVMTTLLSLWQQWWARARVLIANAWQAMRTAVSNGIAAVINFIRTLPQRAFSALATFGSRMVQRGREGLQRFREGASNAFTAMLTWVRQIPQRILQALGNIGNLLINAGRNLIRGFTQGIRNVINAPVDAVRSMVSGVRNLLPFSPAKEGPLAGAGYTLFSGRTLAEDWAKGMLDNVGAVQNASERLADAARSEVEPILSEVAGPSAMIPNSRRTSSDHDGASSTTAEELVQALGRMRWQIDPTGVARLVDTGNRQLNRRGRVGSSG